MIFDYKNISEQTRDMSNHTNCLDNIIRVGLAAYNTSDNSYVSHFSNSTTAQFVITSTLFPKYYNVYPYSMPIAPTFNKGLANNVSEYVYDGFKELYELSKSKATVDYNTVSVNIGRASVFKHRHGFASPSGDEVQTQVFSYRLTNYDEQDVIFVLYTNDNKIEAHALKNNCSFVFNSYQFHETIQRDRNYYAYFIFEKWPE